MAAKTTRELAMEYFEFVSPEQAVRHFKEWLLTSPELVEQLHILGFKRKCRYVTPRMEQLIKEYLGDP